LIGLATYSIPQGDMHLLDLTAMELAAKPIPDYLRNVYTWAYLTPWLTGILDRQIVVQAILWGNAQRLIGDVLAAVKPGDRIFQPAAVYGSFSRQLANQIGRRGHLEVRDIAPLQVALTRQKLTNLPQAHVARGDAVDPDQSEYDAVTCFFLLHEVPDDIKIQIVPAMLGLVRPGGRVIFVDYHRPNRWHPLKPLMKLVFTWLEPFALAMWSQEIEQLAGPGAAAFRWSKRTRFNGMYQVVIAERVSVAVSDAGTETERQSIPNWAGPDPTGEPGIKRPLEPYRLPADTLPTSHDPALSV
jgi:SAM-dependent methyltransferase